MAAASIGSRCLDGESVAHKRNALNAWRSSLALGVAQQCPVCHFQQRLDEAGVHYRAALEALALRLDDPMVRALTHAEAARVMAIGGDHHAADLEIEAAARLQAGLPLADAASVGRALDEPHQAMTGPWPTPMPRRAALR